MRIPQELACIIIQRFQFVGTQRELASLQALAAGDVIFGQSNQCHQIVRLVIEQPAVELGRLLGLIDGSIKQRRRHIGRPVVRREFDALLESIFRLFFGLFDLRLVIHPATTVSKVVRVFLIVFGQA